MEISIGNIPAVKSGLDRRNQGPGAKPYKGKDRRKTRADRRKSVREGIFISLSIKNDRRSRKDRRQSIN